VHALTIPAFLMPGTNCRLGQLKPAIIRKERQY
jgi:hypothetical protein